MNFLILGISGFIGRNLAKRVQSSDLKNVLSIDRNMAVNFINSNNEFGEKLPSLELIEREVCVINFSGATGTNETTLADGNIHFPKKVFDVLLHHDLEIDWIQASSYFQLYKQIYGVDKDAYSRAKDDFLSFLRTSLPINRIQNLFLPHIFGNHESSKRLIPSLHKARMTKSRVLLSSGKAVMPLMSVTNFVSSLHDDLMHSRKRVPENYFMLKNVLSVEEIALNILKDDIDLAKFGHLPDREHEFYAKPDLLAFCNERIPPIIDWQQPQDL